VEIDTYISCCHVLLVDSTGMILLNSSKLDARLIDHVIDLGYLTLFSGRKG